jgi:hypothetical protein
MFKNTNKNANANTPNKMEKAAAIFNARNAVSTAAHKLANVSFAAATAGGTVVASTCYYTANTKHISRKQKRQIGKTNNVACGIAIAGTAVGTVAKLVEGIAQPMPFNPTKYLDDMDEDMEAEIAEAEEAVESHIEPKEETKEGAEQNAQ